MTKDVKERMDLLCGATNYSLALRNSEHAARYALVLHIISMLCVSRLHGEEALETRFETTTFSH